MLQLERRQVITVISLILYLLAKWDRTSWSFSQLVPLSLCNVCIMFLTPWPSLEGLPLSKGPNSLHAVLPGVAPVVRHWLRARPIEGPPWHGIAPNVPWGQAKICLRAPSNMVKALSAALHSASVIGGEERTVCSSLSFCRALVWFSNACAVKLVCLGCIKPRPHPWWVALLKN